MVQEQKFPILHLPLKSASLFPVPCNWQQKVILTIQGGREKKEEGQELARGKNWGG